MLKRIFFIFLSLSCFDLQAQFEGLPSEDDLDMESGNIFSDFSEDLDSNQVLEHERFYRYGRFYSINASLGLTQFTGNRGSAYENSPPTFGLGVTYFFDFEKAFILGFESSKHDMFIDVPTVFSVSAPIGLVNVRMTRVYGGLRHYIDTTNLGTALTYANPYLVGRFEYWYHTNKFENREDIEQQSAGAFGTALGGGLEFPIELKETYLGVELLYHAVSFDDETTQDFRGVGDAKGKGIQNLEGNAFTLMFNYVMSW